MAFKPQEVAEITINGKRFRDWESVVVKLAEGESNPSAKLTVSEGAPLSKSFAEMQIKPGDHCTVTLAGELAFTGYVETRQVGYSATQHGVEILAVGKTKALADGAAQTETQEFRKKSWKQIADEVVKPAGVKVVPKTGLPGKPFERASVPPGMSKFDFLEQLARQRGIILGSDAQGNLTARMMFTGGGAQLVEGFNILEGRQVWTISQGDGPNDAQGQSGGTGEDFGAKVARSRGTAANSSVKGGPGAHAPNVQNAEQAVDKDDAQKRANMESRARGDETFQVTIVVQGWLKTGGGGLWRPGEKAHVKSPMLICDEDLDITTVTFTQDSKKGSLTTIELKRPGGGKGDDGTGEDFGDKGKGENFGKIDPGSDPSGGGKGDSTA
jgi:prophage tail gpP-like protein